MKVLVLLLILVSCGKIRTDNKVKLDGASYSYVLVKFEFLEQIKQLCTDIHPEYEYPDTQTRNRLISQCTLDKLSILDLEALNKFNDEVCPAPDTIEEVNICEVLNEADI